MVAVPLWVSFCDRQSIPRFLPARNIKRASITKTPPQEALSVAVWYPRRSCPAPPAAQLVDAAAAPASSPSLGLAGFLEERGVGKGWARNGVAATQVPCREWFASARRRQKPARRGALQPRTPGWS